MPNIKKNALDTETQGHFNKAHLGLMLLWAPCSQLLPKFIEKQILQPECFHF